VLSPRLKHQTFKSNRCFKPHAAGIHSSTFVFDAGSKAHTVFETTPFFSFHHANAFEASEGRLVVDTVAMTGIDFGNNIDSGTSVFEGKAGKGVVTRLVIDGKSGKVH